MLRFAKNRILTTENYIMALVRLHLAHGKVSLTVMARVFIFFCVLERYHSLDTKMKTNPLSLEEMILMTIYS